MNDNAPTSDARDLLFQQEQAARERKIAERQLMHQAADKLQHWLENKGQKGVHVSVVEMERDTLWGLRFSGEQENVTPVQQQMETSLNTALRMSGRIFLMPMVPARRNAIASSHQPSHGFVLQTNQVQYLLECINMCVLYGDKQWTVDTSSLPGSNGAARHA